MRNVEGKTVFLRSAFEMSRVEERETKQVYVFGWTR